MSTDYVFSGAKGAPYEEEDAPQAINAYGASKAAGEALIREHCPQHLIIRSSSLYGAAGSSGKGGNFVQTMLRGRARARRSRRRRSGEPHSALALARQLRLLETHVGTLHAVCGACSWYEFAAESSVRRAFPSACGLIHQRVWPTCSAPYSVVRNAPSNTSAWTSCRRGKRR
jgi:dTDP-4-dehydrorhamnose reductase